MRMKLLLRQGRSTGGVCFLKFACIAEVETTTLSAFWFWSHAAGVWRKHCHDDIANMQCLRDFDDRAARKQNKKCACVLATTNYVVVQNAARMSSYLIR